MQSTVANWLWRDNTSVEDVCDMISNTEVVVVNKIILDKAILSRAKSLKLICAAATGVNNIDLDAAKDLGIAVCNVPAYATPSVVQHVFSMLLALSTQLHSYQRDVYNGNWTDSEFFCLLDYPIRELDGLTLGIVGYGELGQAVANVARAFGMNVLIAKRHAADDRKNRVALNEMLEQVDVLSLHCPLTEETRGLMGADELALMKPDAILINTARGGLIDELALLEALQTGLLGGAGLDVLAQEPPAKNNPLIQQPLDNLIITPHSAWASQGARQRLLDEIAKNIQAFSNGEKRNWLNV